MVQPDIKSLQIQLVGFLDEKAPPFCKELWNLLLDAQASEQGVPQKLIAAKKDEMQRQRAEVSLNARSGLLYATADIIE